MVGALLKNPLLDKCRKVWYDIEKAYCKKMSEEEKIFKMWLAVIIIVVAVVAYRLPVVKGFIGETIVKLIIGRTTKKSEKEKFVINNFLIELDNGKTSQTDHILINRNGVFVIETKNYSGRIYGDDTRKEWTQVLNYGKVKNHFYSPVKQNAVHVHHIKELLPTETPIYSAVVFVKGNTTFIKSKYTYSLHGLINLIKAPKGKVLSVGEMEEIYRVLEKKNSSKVVTNAEHVQNIRKTQNDIVNNICPRCGGQLVERKGKYGTFMGCSNYPKCRFVKK